MTSVRNHLPQLNGNRWLTVLLVALLIDGCSPKVRWVSNPANKPAEPTQAPVAKPMPPGKAAEQKVSVISLLLPFGLDHIGPGRSYTDISLKKARIAADYYRGFKLALDSLTFYGYNFKLQLFDSKDDPGVAHSLAYNPKVRTSDLIIGPVFPEDIKALTNVLTAARKPIVSPLSPEPATTFHTDNLVTVNPPLEYHAWAAARYINDNVKPQKIFILRSGYSEENNYTIPFIKAIDSLSKKRIKIIAVTIVRGQLAPIQAQLVAGKKNVFVIPSTDQAFLTIILHSLGAIAPKYPVMLFGHPSWQHFSFLKPMTLQHLGTHITSADDVNYKAAATIAFIRCYRNTWHAEPTAYAVKGFDSGLYFGQLLATDNLKNINKTDFNGLHNSFVFQKKNGLGLINTHVYLLIYDNFALRKVE